MGERRGRGGAGRVGRLATGVVLAVVPLVTACVEPPVEEAGMRLRFEDHAAPGAFERTGTAGRDVPDGAPGLWAAVPGLPRPERAEIVNLDTGDRTTVALFRSAGGTIRLSNAAADALGVTTQPAPVRVTALRSLPAIEY